MTEEDEEGKWMMEEQMESANKNVLTDISLIPRNNNDI